MRETEKRSPERKRMLTCFLSTLFFLLAAHGYRFLNAAFSGDGTLIFQAGEEIPYQISLGRFLQPVWWQIRGAIVAPWLIGLFCLLFLTLSGILVTRMLRIRRTLPVILTCGILTANETLAIANATYIPWSDVYTVALFFALLSAEISLSDSKVRWLAPIPLLISLGLYQSYIAASASIILLALLCRILSEPQSAKAVWTRGIGCIIRLFIGLLLYALILKAILAFGSISASEDYNGVGRVSLVSLPELITLVRDAWLLPVRMLLIPGDQTLLSWHMSLIPQGINWLTVLLILLQAALFFRHTPASALTSVFLLGIFPFAVNFVMVIAKGTVNGLMMYAWSFLYLIPVMLADNVEKPAPRLLPRAAFAVTAVLLFFNIRSGNQLTFKRDLELSATQSAFTRILDRAEQTEGYVPGKTPVVLIGMLPSSSLSMVRPGMAELSRPQGMKYTYSAAYETSQYWYLTEILGENLNLVSHEERIRLTKETPDAASLPRFPQEGCAAMIDGFLFIRVS